MSELNRPVTPGPWDIEWNDGSMHGIQESWTVCIGPRWNHYETENEQDARAIADLPAWIEAHDALADLLTERGMELAEALDRAEKAEAALDEISEWSSIRYPKPAGDNFAAGVEYALRGAKEILARHGFGGDQ